MPTPIDPKRLPALKAAHAACGNEDWWSQRQLAELYGVANSRMTTLIKTRFPAFPAAQRRDDKTHWYPACAAIASMIMYMEKNSAAQLAAARRHTAVMTGEAASPDTSDKSGHPPAPAEPVEQPPLTAGELDRLASAQTRVWKLRKDQGMYTLTSEVHRIARGVNAMITREVMNIVNVIDPNGELDPLKRQRLTNKCRDIVLKMHDELGSFLEEPDDVRRAPGAFIAGTGADGDPQRRRRRTGTGDMGEAA